MLGSGFVIDGERGLVLTAAHAVWGARSLKLATGLGVLHGRIIARAPCDDLALLEIHPRIPGLAALPAAPAGSAGRQLLRSLGRRQADSTGEGDAVASIPVRATARLRSPRRLPLPATGIPLDSPLVPEVSGGPVIDRAGRLVGMAQAMNAPRARRPGRRRAVGPDPATAQAAPARAAERLRRMGEPIPLRRAPGRLRAGDASRVPVARRALQRADRPTRLPGTEGMDG